MSKTRLLWAAALLALLVGLSAGSALAVGWTASAGTTIPDAMVWDQTAAITIDAENTGDTNWPDTYGIVSVDTPSGLPVVPVDRWGVDWVPIAGPVPRDRYTGTPPVLRLAGTYTWAFDIIAPPIASIAYPVTAGPVGPYTAAGPVPLACKWVLADDGAPVAVAPVGKDVAVGKFVDLLDAPNAWCAAQVQQLAGLLPNPIVGGYDPTHYAGDIEVTRDQMAVFIVRATGMATAAPSGKFTDVPADFWASPQIEGMVSAGLVGGYGDGLYHPEYVVTRGQMAMFIARGLLMSTTIPSGGPTATFPDVPKTDIAFNSVELCVDNHIVGGYGDGLYHPEYNVTRAQMAVFIYRSFIQPTPSVILLAGPGLTNVDAYSWDGFSTVTQNPAGAYVGFDVIRMGDTAPAVHFDIMQGATVIADADGVFTSDVATAKATATASGDPYYYAWASVPALADGDYTLVTTVDGKELARKVNFSVGAVTPPTPDSDTIFPTADVGVRGDATLSSGTFANLAADDDSYQVFANAAGTYNPDGGGPGSGGGEWELTLPAGWTPESVLTMEITIIGKVDDVDAVGGGMSTMSSGSNGQSRPLGDLSFAADDTEAEMLWVTANRAKFVDIQYDYGTTKLPAGTMHLIACVCPPAPTTGDQTLPWSISFDMASVKFTYR